MNNLISVVRQKPSLRDSALRIRSPLPVSKMGDDQAWPEVPGLDDWYDNALKAGQGFKTDKEREDYIKSIGDPMMHPLFAENTEDLEGNPLAEALRALREEDKTPIEIATMYKEEGNDWLKKGDKKSLHEAYDRYTHAINVLDGIAQAAVSGASTFNATTGETTEPKIHDESTSTIASLYPSELLPREDRQNSMVPTEMSEEESMLRSQIFSNRAMVSLSLMNYGSCIRDADSSILHWQRNIKAHYRKCKSLAALRKFHEAIDSCNIGLAIDQDNAQILSIKQKCAEELLKSEKIQNILAEKRTEAVRHHTAAWTIMSTTNKKNSRISVGYASTMQNPAQLQEVLPHYIEGVSKDTSNVGWPVILLYPQYSQIDVIQGVTATDMLAVHLAEMFPELSDLDLNGNSSGLAVPWDRDGEYQVSKLAVYAPLESSGRIESLEEWLQSCQEQSALRGEVGAEACETATKIFRKRGVAHESKLLNFNCNISKQPSDFDRAGYLDVHLGSSFLDILTSPGHVLAGGLLSLLVFVRGNVAHTNFLKDVKKRNHGVWFLGPSGAGSADKRLQ